MANSFDYFAAMAVADSIGPTAAYLRRTVAMMKAAGFLDGDDLLRRAVAANEALDGLYAEMLAVANRQK